MADTLAKRSPVLRFLAWCGRVFYDSWIGFDKDDGWAIASHISLSTLTSLFPFLIFIGAIASVFGSPDLADKAAQVLFDAWPQQVAAPIAREVRSVLTTPRTGLATASAFLAVYFASSGIEALRIGLNRAYGLKDARPWWLLRLESIFYIFLGAILLILFSLFVILWPLIWSKATFFLPQLNELTRSFNWLRLGLVTVILFLVLIVIHKFLACGQLSLRDALPGVVFTWAFSLGFGEIFSFYISEFAQNYIVMYAGLAYVMIALVFLYVLACIFILGGEVNAVILALRGRKTAERMPRRKRKKKKERNHGAPEKNALGQSALRAEERAANLTN